jgi:hypothetical protein
LRKRLGDSVTAINTEVGTSDVGARIGEEEGDGTHEINGLTHLTLGDKGSPLLLELWVVIENLLGPVDCFG